MGRRRRARNCRGRHKERGTCFPGGKGWNRLEFGVKNQLKVEDYAIFDLARSGTSELE